MSAKFVFILALIALPSTTWAFPGEETKTLETTLTDEVQSSAIGVIEADITDTESCEEIQALAQTETRRQYNTSSNNNQSKQPGVCFSTGLLPELPKKSASSTRSTSSSVQIAESVALLNSKAKLPGEEILNDLMKRCLGLTGGVSVVPQIPIPGICNIDLKKCDKACTMVTEDKVPPGYTVAASCGTGQTLDDPELDTSCQLIKSSACGDKEPTQVFVHQNSKVSCQSPAATPLNDLAFSDKMNEAINENKCYGFLAKGGYWANRCKNQKGFLSRLRFGDPSHSCEDILKDSAKPYTRLVIACDTPESADAIKGQLTGNNSGDPAQRDACIKLGAATGINRCEAVR